MKCHICNSEVSSGSIMPSGFVCSENCAQIAGSRIKAYHDELLAEPLNTMPENFETHDFERWALKFALHFLKGLSAKERKGLAKSNPILLSPSNLALDFKERILRYIKACYVLSGTTANVFCSGEYCFRRPVPATHIVEAARKAQLLA